MVPNFWLQICERIHFCCFKPSGLWQQAHQPHTVTWSPVLLSLPFGYLWNHPFTSSSCHQCNSDHHSVSQFSSVAQSCPTLRPHELQHTRPPCPLPTPRVYSNSCLSSRWCHPAISSSVIPFSSCPQSLPASGSFPKSQLFTSGGQSIGVSASASILPMNTQDWSPLGWTGWISLQSKGLSTVFSNTTVQSINSLALSFLHSPTLTSIHDHRKNHSLD